MTKWSCVRGRARRRFNHIIWTALAALMVSAGWGWAGSGGGWGGLVSRPQSPIGGSTVTFYAAGATGYGQGASVLATTTSNSDGSFIISSYTCPSASVQTYLTATGGDAGHGDNRAIGMMALTGPCGSLTASSFVTINELTTVAAQWAMARFIDTCSESTIGTSSTNATGLKNAVNLSESDLVLSYLLSDGSSSNTGLLASFLPTATQCSSGTPPVNCDGLERLDTLANIIASCINSSGSSSTQCRQLFCGATPGASWNGTSCSVTPTATDTLAAAHAIVTHPTSNVSTIFDVPPPPGMTLFEPVLTSAPADWTLALNFSPPGANFSGPTGLALDSSGNVWVSVEDNPSVTELNSTGELIGNFNNANTPGANFVYPAVVAVESSGNVWVTNYFGNSVTELNSHGDLIGNFAPAGANFSQPGGVALDSSGNVWVGNHLGNSVTGLNSSGDLVGNFAPAGANFNVPSGVALNGRGDVWVTNIGGDSVTDLNSMGDLVGNFAPAGANFSEPGDVAIDSSGSLWVTNIANNSVTELKSTGALIGNFAPAGADINWPVYAAPDSSGNLWVTNAVGNSVSALIGLAAPTLTPFQACLQKGHNVCLP
jgi:streptogramin lyase